MKRSRCDSIRRQLGAYVDGELSGAERLRLSRHLETCAGCAREVDEMVAVGDVLRGVVADEPPPMKFVEGLASGVVTRVRAEGAMSWGAKWHRAVGDSRLLWVGTGSVLGALATMLVVGFALFFGQTRVAAEIPNHGSAGTLLAVAQLDDPTADGLLVHYVPGAGPSVITEAMLAGPTDLELLDELTNAVTHRGRIVELSDMAPGDRERTENLLESLMRRQTKELVRIEVHQVRLLATADVSAKGL